MSANEQHDERIRCEDYEALRKVIATSPPESLSDGEAKQALQALARIVMDLHAKATAKEKKAPNKN